MSTRDTRRILSSPFTPNGYPTTHLTRSLATPHFRRNTAIFGDRSTHMLHTNPWLPSRGPTHLETHSQRTHTTTYPLTAP
jgi:hypothetical protein